MRRARRTSSSSSRTACRTRSPSYVDSLIKGAPLNLGSAACTDASLLPGSACQAGGGTPINGGTCLSALTSYMANRATYPIQSYFLAFGSDPCLVAGFNYIQNAAQKGGGNAYLVQDANTLTSVLNQIGAQVLQIATSFTSPTVAVNAFNRTQTLNDVFFETFIPSTDYHWPGNVKHYTLSTSGTTSGQFVDANANPAISAGFISTTARSAFATEPTLDANEQSTTAVAGVIDGATVTKGGAADLLPGWQARQVFTYVGTNPASPVSLGVSTSANAYSSTSAYQARDDEFDVLERDDGRDTARHPGRRCCDDADHGDQLRARRRPLQRPRAQHGHDDGIDARHG